MATLTSFLQNAQTPTGATFVISVLLIICFIFIILNAKKLNLSEETFRSLAALFVLIPVLALLSVLSVIAPEAAVTLIGSVVGYFFGAHAPKIAQGKLGRVGSESGGG